MNNRAEYMQRGVVAVILMLFLFLPVVFAENNQELSPDDAIKMTINQVAGGEMGLQAARDRLNTIFMSVLGVLGLLGILLLFLIILVLVKIVKNIRRQ